MNGPACGPRAFWEACHLAYGAAPPLVKAWQLAGWYDPRFPILGSPSRQKVARAWERNGYLAGTGTGTDPTTVPLSGLQLCFSQLSDRSWAKDLKHLPVPY